MILAVTPEGVQALGSILILIAGIAAIAKSLLKRQFGDVIITIIVIGLAAAAINDPSQLVKIGKFILEASIDLLEGGMENNVFK